MTRALVQAVRITDRMIECRDTLFRLWGSNYDRKIAGFRAAIVLVAEHRHISHLEAAILLGQEATAAGAPGQTLGYLAAGADLAEQP